MYFVSQYVQTYKENGKTYDEYFYGNFYYNGRLVEKGEYIVTDEGLDIAAAQMTNLGNTKAEVNGCAVTVYMTDTDQSGTETQFTSMQYYADDGEQLLKFNLNIPQFPLTMVKTSNGLTSARAMARKPASKLSLKQHTKLRDVQRKENAHHTVARKAASATVVRKAGN